MFHEKTTNRAQPRHQAHPCGHFRTDWPEHQRQVTDEVLFTGLVEMQELPEHEE